MTNRNHPPPPPARLAILLLLAALAAPASLLPMAAFAEECSVPYRYDTIPNGRADGSGRYIVNPNPATGCAITCYYGEEDQSAPVVMTEQRYREYNACPEVVYDRSGMAGRELVRGYKRYSWYHSQCLCPATVEEFGNNEASYIKCGDNNERWEYIGQPITMNLNPGQRSLDTERLRSYRCGFDGER